MSHEVTTKTKAIFNLHGIESSGFIPKIHNLNKNVIFIRNKLYYNHLILCLETGHLHLDVQTEPHLSSSDMPCIYY